MSERIVKNKRVSKCWYCNREITTEYKVRYKDDNRARHSRHYHLTCHYRNTLRQIRGDKEELSELYKTRRKLKRFKKYMILEGLGENL